MAGIGFELRRMLARDSYAALAGAYGYAGLIACGPWVMSILGMLAITVAGVPPILARSSDTPPLEAASFMAMGVFAATDATHGDQVAGLLTAITWSIAGSLILTGPLQLLFGRFVADRIYEKDRRHIVPNVLGALQVATVASGSAAAAAVYLFFDLSVSVSALLVASFVIFSDGWVLLVLLSGVKAHRAVVAVFFAGQLVSVGGASGLARFGLTGLLAGFVTGQAVMLFGMLILILRSFPGERTIRFDFLRPSFARYELALVGLVFYLGTWADKLVFWLNPSTSRPVFGPLRASVIYDLPIFLACLSAIPAMAVFFLRLEADFADRCQNFLRAVREGATLAEIEELHDRVVVCVRRGLTELLQTQAVTLVVMFAVGPALLEWVGISPLYLRLLLVDSAAVALQVVFLAILNVFFYLDERAIALGLSALFGISNTLFTLLTQQLGPDWYGFGFAAAALSATAAGLPILSRKLARLDRDTFMKQPLWPAARRPLSH